MSDVALANEPAARTETGEIKDQTPTTPPTEPTKPEPTTSSPTEKPSLVNEKAPGEPKPAEGAPEKYEAFKVPEGFEMPEERFKEAADLFKKHNLSQPAAQEMVDYYHKLNQEAAEAPFKLWQDTQEKWQNAVRLDPEVGPKLNEVKSTISKAIDNLGDQKLANDFRDAMDYTGAGNNLAFIKAFYRLAQRVTEGGHVSGTGPTKFGQTAPGTAEKPTAARALYPNLP
jgi:hypothetical protein